MCSESAAVSRDLPMPGSPEISTTRPSPPFTCCQRRTSSSTSSSRPTSGVSAERKASKRLNIPLSASTRQANCGAAKPANSCGPRSSRSNSPPTCRRVASPMTSVFGMARACSRAARFGVSPTTPRSCAAPLPIRSPTTASPVAIPSRTRSSSRVGKLPTREELRVRLGIATGLAVVGDLIGKGAAQERGVVGETPNLAARLQALAMPNTLVIGEATRRQVGGLFDLEDLGPQEFAGFAAPQLAWRVLAESGMLSRFEALRSAETPLVGREEEVELLVRRWQQVKGGEGRVVLISGEPGIGKSRLTAALSEHIGTEPHTRLRYFCSPHHQDSALYPFVAHLERAARFTRDDTIEEKLDKLQALLAPGMRDDDDITLLSERLSLPNSAAELNLSPQRKREKLFKALLGQLAAEAMQQPVLMVFEDAHWIDPTSRELLDMSDLLAALCQGIHGHGQQHLQWLAYGRRLARQIGRRTAMTRCLGSMTTERHP